MIPERSKPSITRGNRILPTTWTELNYLEVCERAAQQNIPEATAVLSGFESVCKQKTDQFQYLYPCHSPTHHAWYNVRISPLGPDHPQLYMVAHEDRTVETLTRQALEKEADTDGLTGLGNRRGCQRFLDQQWRRDLRTDDEISVLSIEINQYQEYKKLYGAEMSNSRVAQIASAIRTVARRPGDYAARTGMEKFVVVLGTTNQRDALAIATQLSSNVQSLTGKSLQKSPDRQISVSIGVAAITPNRHLIASELLNKSSEALHRATSIGFNSVST